jgi:hypothetical protein
MPASRATLIRLACALLDLQFATLTVIGVDDSHYGVAL